MLRICFMKANVENAVIITIHTHSPRMIGGLSKNELRL